MTKSQAILLLIGIFSALPNLGLGNENNSQSAKEFFLPSYEAEVVKSISSDSPAQRTVPGWQQLTLPTGSKIVWNESGLAKISPNEQGELELSFFDALALANLNNLQTLLALENNQQSIGEMRQALAALLPQLQGTVFQTRQTTNLVSEGFAPGTFATLPNVLIGPYNNFDARIYLMQTIFDWSSLNNYRAGKSGYTIAKLQVSLARLNVTSIAGSSYIQVLQSQALLRAALSDFTLAQRLLKQTRHQYAVGIGTQVDLTRAETQVSENQTRVLSGQTNLDTAQLGLKRLLMLPMGSQLVLNSTLKEASSQKLPIRRALAIANQHRPELKIIKETVRQKELERKAALGKQLPSLGFAANYGASAETPTKEVFGTYQYGAQVNIPIFNGGHTLASMKIAKSQKHQAQLRLRDLKQQINEEVRIALRTLQLSGQKVRSTSQTLKLAKREIEQAQHRFFSGVGDNVEVIQAQNTLSRARSNRALALAQYNQARINLASALGQMEDFNL